MTNADGTTLNLTAAGSSPAVHVVGVAQLYPKDEAPAAYKDFNEVLRSVTAAGLATEVARLRARFVIKDGDKADD